MTTPLSFRAIALVSGLALLLIIALTACDDRITRSAAEQSAPFPNTVGTYWVYEVVDSVRATTDTVTISIVDTVTLPGLDGVTSIWTCEPRVYYVGGPNPTQYVLADPEIGTGTSKDTVQFYFWMEGNAPWMFSTFPLPLEPGDNWTSDLRYMFDSTHVQERVDVVVPAGEFDDALRLSQTYSCGDECSATYNYWWKEGQGMVKSHLLERDHFDFPSEPNVIATWVLIDYNIAE